MNEHAHVHKTSKGEEEIQTRSHKLRHELRYVLILVDGESTVAQILEKGAGLPHVQESLAELAAEGYITVGDAVTAPKGPKGVAEVKGELIAVAKEVLGKDASSVVHKLEAAPDSKEALLEVAHQCKKVVKLTIDEKKAEQLLARCSALLEAL